MSPRTTPRLSGIAAENSGKTHCNNGHPFDEANTYFRTGRRACRACNCAAVTRYKAQRRPAGPRTRSPESIARHKALIYARLGSSHERLMRNVEFDTNGGCWLWAGGLTGPMEYGSLRFQGRQYHAHRLAWQAAFGAPPPGIFVCHKCDVPRCVNPAHLFLGTALDNNRDCARKGRSASPAGDRHYRAKLTAEIIPELLARLCNGETQTSVAKSVGVTKTAISKLARGINWRAAL